MSLLVLAGQEVRDYNYRPKHLVHIATKGKLTI
jgi:hypothetical protein